MSETNLTIEERLTLQEYLMSALIGVYADDLIVMRRIAERLNDAIAGAEKSGALSATMLAELRRQADWLVGLHLLPDPLKPPLRP